MDALEVVAGRLDEPGGDVWTDASERRERRIDRAGQVFDQGVEFRKLDGERLVASRERAQRDAHCSARRRDAGVVRTHSGSALDQSR